MAVHAPFNAQRGSNQVITLVAAAASTSSAINKVAKCVRLVNPGLNICHVRIGTGVQVASVLDTPILSGSEIILTKGDGEDTIAHISAAGSTLNIQTGEGGI